MVRPPLSRRASPRVLAGLIALALCAGLPLWGHARSRVAGVGGRPRAARPLRLAMRTLPLTPAWTHHAESQEEAPDLPEDLPGPGGIDAARVRGAADRAACLAELRRLRIPFREANALHLVQHPVEITGPLHGVQYKALYSTKPPLVDCHFALGLEKAARVLAGFGVTTVLYTSTYRSPPRSSWQSPGHHPQGMAMDVNELLMRDGTRLVILKDWEKQYGGPGSCVGRPRTMKGTLLRKMTCALEDAHIFQRILSPDSDFPHRNHWHISGARIGEAFVRRRYSGRALDQPLPGDRGFAGWYRWYSCWQVNRARARYLCYQRRARGKPRPPVRFRAPAEAPRVAIWLPEQVAAQGAQPDLPASARAVELPPEPPRPPARVEPRAVELRPEPARPPARIEPRAVDGPRRAISPRPIPGPREGTR